MDFVQGRSDKYSSLCMGQAPPSSIVPALPSHLPAAGLLKGSAVAMQQWACLNEELPAHSHMRPTAPDV